MLRVLRELSVGTQLVLFLALHTLLRLGLACSLPLTYKEAYFWGWSQHLDWGYLEHPPMVAWIMGISGYFFEEASPLILRWGAVGMGTCSLFLLYRLAQELFESTSVALKAVLIGASFPVMNAVGVLMLPDTPLLLFQLLALNCMAALLKENSKRGWLALGLCLGWGMLSKLMMGLTLFALVPFLWIVKPREGKKWGREGPFLCFFCMGIVITPFLFWNQKHQWANLRLQLWERHFWDFGFELGKVGEFAFEQMAAASPFLFPFLCVMCVLTPQAFPKPWRAGYTLLRLQMLAHLLFFALTTSVITQAHPHWTLLAYPPLALLLALSWERFSSRRFWRSLPLAVTACQGLLFVVVCVASSFPHVVAQVDPQWLGGALGRGLVKGQQRLFGFEALAKEVRGRLHEHGLEKEGVLFTDGYQFSALLSFACQEYQIVCLPAYLAENHLLGHAQALYFPIEELVGKSGLYLSRDSGKGGEEELAESFEKVTPLAPIEQRFQGVLLKEYRLFKVENFRGIQRALSRPIPELGSMIKESS